MDSLCLSSSLAYFNELLAMNYEENKEGKSFAIKAAVGNVGGKRKIFRVVYGSVEEVVLCP
jgi:hypothetical protein